MQCRRIRLRDFRNVEEAEVHFSPGVNLLHGDNAQGKTNLLEALYYTALGKTFRTGHDEELIRFGAESAMIENCFSPAETVGQAGQAGQADSTLLFRLLRGRGGRAVDRNGVRVRSMSEVVGGFRVVLFCPAHLSVVQGSPEDRRDFLNVAISQLRPVYVRALKRFNRALRERNALLRQAQDAGGSFLPDSARVPFYIDPNTPVIQTLIRTYNDVTGKNAQPFTMGGGTYARHFKCAVSFGMEETGEPAPEWVGPMHGPDEGVSEALLFKALKIYILAIARLMQLEF